MKSSFNTIINSKTPVLVDFFGTWCGPCQSLMPILGDVKKELGDSIKIVKIDIDKNEALAQKYQVRSVPTLVFYKEGKPLWRKSGVLPKESIINMIKTHS